MSEINITSNIFEQMLNNDTISLETIAKIVSIPVIIFQYKYEEFDGMNGNMCKYDFEKIECVFRDKSFSACIICYNDNFIMYSFFGGMSNAEKNINVFNLGIEETNKLKQLESKYSNKIVEISGVETNDKEHELKPKTKSKSSNTMNDEEQELKPKTKSKSKSKSKSSNTSDDEE